MTARRYELTDFEWSIIEPLLPNKPRGVPRVDDRRVLNGIYWRLRTGSPMTIRVHWSTTEPLSKPVFGLAIETLEGHYLWAHHSRDGDCRTRAAASWRRRRCCSSRTPRRSSTPT